MSLKSLDLKPTYSTEESSLLEDFYVPALSQSEYYDRAVGFFSAGMLSYAAQGLSQFVTKNGKIRLLVGEPLKTEEYEAVRRGIEIRAVEERIYEKMKAILEHADTILLTKRLELLSWLIAANRLEIRFCLTDRGMFHEKMGVLTDDDGNRIVFQGSANETVAALLPDFNFESIAVFPSWKPEIFEAYALPYINRFELIWLGYAQRVVTIDIPSRSYEELKTYYKKSTPPGVNEPRFIYYIEHLTGDGGYPKHPTVIGTTPYQLRLHQKDALQEWQAKDYRGILAHATGSGKTISALHGATSLASYHKSQNRNFVLIVSVPYQVLADQWCEVMGLFGIQPHRCYRGKQYWQTELRQDIASLNVQQESRFLGIVVVNATLRSMEFQNIISKIDANDLFFVGDECHHHQRLSILKKLPDARYRLGLSATPWRTSDQEAQNNLQEYYSSIVSIYSIRHALRDGVLVPYLYNLHQIELTDEEAEEYQELSDKVAQLVAAKENGSSINEDYLRHLILSRARILGSATGKFQYLAKSINSERKKSHNLFYCGDGSTDVAGETNTLRDVEKVAGILNRYGWKSSRFTAEDGVADRRRILANFRYAYIDAIVAIRVLDEGFDMPECQTAYLLASSRNERQFIQRRGRILRTSPGKDSAIIHDYIMRPPSGFRSASFQSMIHQELVRALEFARFSENESQARGIIANTCSDFGLDIEDIEHDVLMMEVRVE